MNLLRNEFVKLLKLKKLYIFLLILLVNEALVIYFYKFPGSMKSIIVSPNGQSVPLTLVNGMAQFMTIFIPIYLADSITGEYRSGTLKLSLLQPVDRLDLLRAKLAALFIFITLIVSFSVLSSYIMGTVAFGWGSYTGYAGTRYAPAQGIVLTLTAYALLLLPYLAYGMMAAFVAVSATNGSTTIVLCITAVTAGQYLNSFAALKPFSLVNQMYFYHEYFLKGLNWPAAILSTAVIFGYVAVFYLLAAHRFSKKDIVY